MNQKPISESAPMGCVGKAALCFLGLALAVGGGAGFWFLLVQPWSKTSQAEDWPTTECEIVESRVERHQGDDNDTFSAEISFKYVVENQEYRSHTYSFYQWSGSRSAAEAVCNKYPVGTKKICYYNPVAPAAAVLDRTFGWASMFALAFLLLPLIGLAIIYFTLFSSGRKVRDRFKFESEGMDNLVYQREDTIAEIFTPELQGPQKLKPGSSRISGLIFMFVLLAGFGIASVVVYNINGFSILSVILGVVTLVIFSGVLHQVLSLTNPVVEVALSNGTLVPGETVDIAWETTGKYSRFRTLQIFVYAEETAEYTRGTDRVTDRESVFLTTVADITDKQEMQFGSTTFTVPDDAVHSFRSNNNTLTWSIKVLGAIPMWPDVSEEFKFMVQPNE